MLIQEPIVKTIPVADIAEYPTDLGRHCLLLTTLGVCTYTETEEEIMQHLELTAKNLACLDICKKDSRCGKVYQKFMEGDKSPFAAKDPIKLIEYNGKYRVSEGKHRVCLAKRAGIKEIEGYVWSIEEDPYTLLPPKQNYRTFEASYYNEVPGRYPANMVGKMLVLWHDSIPFIGKATRFSFTPLGLNIDADTQGEWKEAVLGVKYRVTVTQKYKHPLLDKLLFREPRQRFTVFSEVSISNDHANTRIWLMELCMSNFKHGYTAITTGNTETLFRTGLWRKKDLKVAVRW